MVDSLSFGALNFGVQFGVQRVRGRCDGGLRRKDVGLGLSEVRLQCAHAGLKPFNAFLVLRNCFRGEASR